MKSQPSHLVYSYQDRVRSKRSSSITCLVLVVVSMLLYVFLTKQFIAARHARDLPLNIPVLVSPSICRFALSIRKDATSFSLSHSMQTIKASSPVAFPIASKEIITYCGNQAVYLILNSSRM